LFGDGAAGSVAAEGEAMDQLRRALVLGIRDYVRKCGFKRVLIGLSGGIDSAIVAALAVEAIGAENVHGVAMPSRYSSDHSIADAKALAENLRIRFSIISIEEMFRTALVQLTPNLEGSGRQIAEENLQSRLRGMTLMALSNASGDLVLTTGNKSELSVGYCTLYGDMCGGLAAIGDVPKTLVYALSRHVNEHAGREIIPESTLTKEPSAELRPDQKDTDSLPPYDILDPIIRGYTEEGLDADALIARGSDPQVVRRVLRMIEVNEYKRRQSPPVLKVTSRAFGYGWRMPIARR
ncbi:MAG TPA: NAD(+) synthase, partial [Candidatus Sumerlaeota bacterium]|nr:NAD(+) synthase [Candidatus Sumerlaeota bacterium]